MPKTIKEFQLNQSTGEVSVEYSDDSTSKFNAADMVTAQTDAVTGGISLSSGGVQINAAQISGNASGVISFGNSIIYASGSYSMLEHVCGLSGGALHPIRNAGIPGDTTRPRPATGAAGMTARFDADVGAYKPAIVLALEAFNNNSVGITVSQACADMLLMANKTKSFGGRFIIVGSPNFNDTPAAIGAYNLAYQALADKYGFEFVDPWQDSINTTTGQYLDATYSADGIHPTPKAIRLAAARVWSYLSGTVNATRRKMPRFNADTNNRISNPLNISGTNIPTGWSPAQGTHTTVLTAGQGDVPGNWWDITKTASADMSAFNGTFTWTGLAGKRVFIGCRYKTSGFEANGVTANAGQGKVDARLQLSFYSGAYAAITESIGMDVSEGIIGRYFDIPANETGATLQVWFGGRGGASISGTLSLSQFFMYVVPTDL